MQKTSLSDLWKRFEHWLESHAPGLLDELADGALVYQIQDTEEEVGVKFPRDYIDSLTYHDGGYPGNGLIGNWDLLGLQDLTDAYFELERQLENGAFGRNETIGTSFVKGRWWHPLWVPFAGDTDGNYLCLDMAPGWEGEKGQVILYLADESARRVLATSYTDWMEQTVQGLEEGRFPVKHDEDLDIYIFEKPGLIEPW